MGTWKLIQQLDREDELAQHRKAEEYNNSHRVRPAQGSSGSSSDFDQRAIFTALGLAAMQPLEVRDEEKQFFYRRISALKDSLSGKFEPLPLEYVISRVYEPWRIY